MVHVEVTAVGGVSDVMHGELSVRCHRPTVTNTLVPFVMRFKLFRFHVRMKVLPRVTDVYNKLLIRNTHGASEFFSVCSLDS